MAFDNSAFPDGCHSNRSQVRYLVPRIKSLSSFIPLSALFFQPTCFREFIHSSTDLSYQVSESVQVFSKIFRYFSDSSGLLKPLRSPSQVFCCNCPCIFERSLMLLMKLWMLLFSFYHQSGRFIYRSISLSTSNSSRLSNGCKCPVISKHLIGFLK